MTESQSPFRNEAREQAPANVIPVSLGLNVSLYRSDQLYIGLTQFLVWPESFEFTLLARVHPGSTLDVGTMTASGRHNQSPDDEALDLRVRWPDGIEAGSWTHSHTDAPEPLLKELGGGSAGLRAALHWHAWPLPAEPVGLVIFSCSWPAAGVDNAEGGLPTSILLDGASQAEILWLDDRPVQEQSRPQRGTPIAYSPPDAP